MLIEAYLSKEVEPVGDNSTFYIDTSNSIFIEEIKKYKCPVRLIDFLDEEFKNNNEVTELIRLPKNTCIDLLIDLSNETIRIMALTNDFMDFDKYLQNTIHLDKYGNTRYSTFNLEIYSKDNKLYVLESAIKKTFFYDFFYDFSYGMKALKLNNDVGIYLDDWNNFLDVGLKKYNISISKQGEKQLNE